jgi:hypothetical protein
MGVQMGLDYDGKVNRVRLRLVPEDANRATREVLGVVQHHDQLRHSYHRQPRYVRGESRDHRNSNRVRSLLIQYHLMGPSRIRKHRRLRTEGRLQLQA